MEINNFKVVSRTAAYPMPRVDDLIDWIGGAKFITTLDLSKGYWQVPVREQDGPKTALTSPQGMFQFCVMPFGLQGAPVTFQRMMDLYSMDSETPQLRTSTTLLYIANHGKNTFNTSKQYFNDYVKRNIPSSQKSANLA